MPLAAHATLAGNTLSIKAAWGDHLIEKPSLIFASDQCTIDPSDSNILNTATSLGELVANKLIAQGARPVTTH